MKTRFFFLLIITLNTLTYGQSTFTECYYSYDQTKENKDIGEVLYDVYIDGYDQYIVFGKEDNEFLLSNNKGDILHHTILDGFGFHIDNLNFSREYEESNNSISGLNHKKLNTPICNAEHWLLVNENYNGSKDVVLYEYNTNLTNILTSLNLTPFTNGNHYTCNEFIQSSSNEVIWVGEEASSLKNITLGQISSECVVGDQLSFILSDPVTGTSINSGAYFITELNQSFNNAKFAVTGYADRFVFCLLLDQNLNATFSNISLYDIDADANTIESGLVIRQLSSGNLVIGGNHRPIPGGIGKDNFFILELDQNLDVVSSNIYNEPTKCIRLKDLEIQHNGNYIIAGDESYFCDVDHHLMLNPSRAYLAEIVPNNSAQWAYRYHQNRVPDATSFNELDIIRNSEGSNELVAVGSCWDRKGVGSGGGGDESESIYLDHLDFFVVKTDEMGLLINDPSCSEKITITREEQEAQLFSYPFEINRYPNQNVSQDFRVSDQFTQKDFCDFEEQCCQTNNFNSIFVQGANYVVNGCQSVTVNLNAVGTCWEVTWFWGDGTSTGPIQATTDPLTHTYSQGGSYLISWYIEEIDSDGNVCNFGTMDFGDSIEALDCACQECPAGGTAGPELVINGDFNGGFSGFNTTFSNTNCSGYGAAYVHDNLSLHSCNVHWCGTGTSGTSPIENDPFLIADAFRGDPSNRDLVWEQSIYNLDEASVYTFCTKARNIVLPNSVLTITDPVIDIEINGQLMVSNFSLGVSNCETNSPFNCDWTDVSVTWNSQNDNSAVISIYLYQADCPTYGCAVFGADLGLDDISFRKCDIPSPEGRSQEQSEKEKFSSDQWKKSDFQDLWAYPNPTDQFLNIEMEQEATYDVALINLLGRKVLSKSGKFKSKAIEVNQIPPGTYILVVQNIETGSQTTTKIIVSR